VTSKSLPRVIALAPQGIEGITIAAAACRANALGLVDCVFDDIEGAREALAQLAKLTSLPYGIRVRAHDVLSTSVVTAAVSSLDVISIPVWSAESEDLARAARLVRESGRLAFADVTTRAEAQAAQAGGFDALMLSGNESAGWCSQESSFVLLQGVLAESSLPVWVRGGIGPNVAAGCLAAGAKGVVLDGALILARESRVPAEWRERIARSDGSETTVITPRTGVSVRVYALPGSLALARLKHAADLGGRSWEDAVSRDVGWRDGQCAPVGQDVAFAEPLARRFVTTGGIIQAIERSIVSGISDAAAARPLVEGSALAVDHGTRYPILQGPMTRVSDVAAFAQAVARGGGLPFLALALLREPEVRNLLLEAARMLGPRPWGVGILGFVPPELRAEQLAVVREVKPPFALIAGGRPDQSAGLEREGIATYLHAPSPGLLDQYLRDGARRFVLEGRECGGHVGPRSSFVLWEQAVACVGEALDRGVPANEFRLIFAGGIQDARSAALVAALAGPLAVRGVRTGILIGTAYLFTQEAVSTGAIVPRFQDEVLRCESTVLLESGPGHQVRVSPTPFVAVFEQERARLLAAGRSTEEIREALEGLNVGRLRVATKGVDRGSVRGSKLEPKSDLYQAAHGLYMLGQVAVLRSQTTTIADLHHELSSASSDLVDQAFSRESAAQGPLRPAPKPSDIAIIGMSAVLPGAATASRFWSNTLKRFDAIVEIPPDRWNWRLYYDSDPKAPDKIISKWGGFLPDIPFDPIRYGMPPSSLPSIEPAQLIALEVVRSALADAGYADRPFPREQTGVVLGMGGGAAQLAMGFAFRSYLPMLDTVLPDAGRQAVESCQGLLPEWTEDSFPGFLLNVTAGRIANRLNLGGSNYTVDAACGSSLAAAALAVRELETGAADMVVLGGVDTVQNPFTYLAFSKTQAFSPRGRCRPFDAGADGIVISEGVAALVLKRLADAERDGDRIYAVIKGVGASSDGRARGLTAPVVDGQMRALERAYAKAGVSPSSVGYVEAHGTGTALGDVVEIEALGRLFQDAGARPGHCVVGSVKSSIGHTKCAAGLAGLINASLSLYHNVLPPTIGIESPNPKLDLREGPFRLCTEAQPWLNTQADQPRRAGVSAFGFGGTNFHAVLEAYDQNIASVPSACFRDWPTELLVWRAESPNALAGQLDELSRSLSGGARPHLCDLSHALVREWENRATRPDSTGDARLAVVAASHEDLQEKLGLAHAAITQGKASLEDPRGLFFEANAPWSDAPPVAFLFPGQGAQSPGMLRELAVIFPEVRQAFEEFDRVLEGSACGPVGPLVFPPPAFSETAREDARRRLMETDVAQPAVGAACLAMLRLLRGLGCEPALLGGHSFGELVALHAAGVFDARALAELSSERGRLMKEAGAGNSGAMAALRAGPADVDSIIRQVPGAQAANWNGPAQTVIAGPAAAVDQAIDLAARSGIASRLLPVSSAFHTPLVAGAREPFGRVAERLLGQQPDRPVYSNLDAAPHPALPAQIAARLADHLASPVRFGEMIDAMYKGGARVFVEVGPGGALTPLIGSVLGERQHLAVATQPISPVGIAGWLYAIARLTVAGVPLRLERLTRDRVASRFDLKDLPTREEAEPTSASTWLVNGSRARPINEPEISRLGQGSILESTAPALLTEKSGAAPAPTVAGSRSPATSQGPRRGGAPSPQHRNGDAAMHPLSASARNGNGARRTHMKPQHQELSNVDPVIESFQQTMQMFLEVQRSTMLAYLSGRGAGTPPPASTFAPDFKDRSRNHTPARSNAPHTNGDASEARARPSAEGIHRVPQYSPAPPANDKPHAAPNGKPHEHDAAPAKALDRASITSRLLETVRDRTGYPLETLGLDLDMEADLGIDSIKRVEILGKMRDEFPVLKGLSDSAEAMDALARARTLGVIVDRMTSLAEQANGRSESETRISPGSPARQAHSNGKLHEPIGRRLLEAIDSSLPIDRLGLMPGGRVLITDDGTGVAIELASLLQAADVAVCSIGGPDLPIDWSSPSAIDSAVERLRAQGPIAGLIHALPLAHLHGEPDAPSDWAARIGAEVRGLFLLAKATASDLESAAQAGGACLIAATAMGGRFASKGSPALDFFPGDGGVAGLVKTLAREWPSIRCRVVDFSPDAPRETIAAQLADEIFVNDGFPEAGYEGDRRLRLHSVAGPLIRKTSAFELKPGEPVLISGGARGITALVAAELARTWRPTLLMVGTTPLPQNGESADTSGLIGETEIKAALHARFRHEGGLAGPARIESAYQSLKRAREVRENIEILREAGSTVAYAQADVRDPGALAQVVDQWRARYGEPVGLIHGAGLIKDKLIRQKSIESFDRVLETKLYGALNLIRLVRQDTLKFTVLFSSIAGRFGNVGQSDYAAANEILSKLAHWLDRRSAGRVVSVIWGPWSGVGMVSQLEKHLGRRGLGMISPNEGPSMLVDELRYGQKGDVEVILSGKLGTLEEPVARARAAEPLEIGS
jgi:acyl transferase domain-containing protein/NAD(P)H-dependent flavin oxidoreductase YrpB (nitropropane dioxygenase family)